MEDFIVKILTQLQIIHRFNAISIKISTIFFVHIDNIILKTIYKVKGSRIVRILKKNKVEEIILADFKTYDILIKTA